MSDWDIYIVSPRLDRPAIVRATGNNPDDALTVCQAEGNYFPEIDDRVIRMVEVNRGTRGKYSK